MQFYSHSDCVHVKVNLKKVQCKFLENDVNYCLKKYIHSVSTS